ncbi:MAG: LysM peptidoglycan-binding domain-containing protein [Oscillospiraceae bacterium]|nr:LysM peptidoglycan-binding domain-containing protein [Oscillospiraceae bacterium]
MQIHVAKPGDTLYAVARAYGIEPRILAGLNGLGEAARLAVGQALVVRFPALVHTVVPGDTLYTVARRYGTDIRTLCRNNYPLGGRDVLRPGEPLVIRYADGARLGALEANAYAYPFIGGAQLDAALPYLTYLTPFTYGFTQDAELVPLRDTALLSAASRQGVAPLMHLSTLTEDGGFSNERSSQLLGSEAMQDKLIRNLTATLRQKGYYGLDVDFEFVFPQERVLYADFIRRVRDALNPLGFPVLVALAPKTRSDQPGLLYEAHDYTLLGAAANAVLLMTYEWGYTYGPPMAVAPLPQVRAVLDYAVREIEREKIFLGVPLYGYDWPLPYVRGETRAESLSPQFALELALENRAEILYDEDAQSPYFYYTDRTGRAHAVWFEDARSIEAKLRLVAEYGLRGVGYWSLMRDMPQNWTVLHALYDVKTML